MTCHFLNVVVGPRVFEALQYTKWCSISKNFEWGPTDRPLILFDWIPIERRQQLLTKASTGHTYVVLGHCKVLDEASLDWLTQLWSE
eukprot:3938943-Rhodomonas_salina.1